MGCETYTFTALSETATINGISLTLFSFTSLEDGSFGANLLSDGTLYPVFTNRSVTINDKTVKLVSIGSDYTHLPVTIKVCDSYPMWALILILMLLVWYFVLRK